MSESFDKNKEFELEQGLTKLGLSDKQAKVYLALVRLGEVGSSKLVKETALHGQFVYQALDVLAQKGLVNYEIKRGRKKFSAKSPYVLVRMIEEQRNTVNALATELLALMSPKKDQEYDVVKGKEAIVTSQFELLEKAEAGSEMLIIGGAGDELQKMLGKRLFEYEKKRINKNINIRYIGSKDQEKQLKGNRQLFEYKLLPESFSGLVNTIILPNSVSQFYFGEPPVYFHFQNHAVAESQKQFFEALWKVGIKE